MKLITRDTDYALKALCFIVKHKERIVSVSELVNELKIPRSFLRKILQELNKKRVLKSYKGQGGGFSLVKLAHKIFLVDLIEIFQGPLRLNECFLKKMVCPDMRTCVLRKKINQIEKYVIRELKSITITSLSKQGA
ncbi:MAG: Rrf2 family transcriptional regulator [Candidatus Omnitrophica bacterium]|nr:Rrf2 family transcriptional regulator [Candidatus Omnitrophota bacterium]MBU4473356.1 Rrf2 family transcriptional regulator [Candidatus Omnitrophota bacterium]MCG2707010.1 Rrf2 family transcriptional regulator [Candidatus Omnitrophota bacterium]